MKLSDLIEALADEIEIVQPELYQLLEQLKLLSISDESYDEVALLYSEQVQRMGEAAEMVGFDGLQSACVHVESNIDYLKNKDVSDRSEVISFLERWPDFFVHYLKHIEEPDSATALVEFLTSSPCAMPEYVSLELVQKLSQYSIGPSLSDTSDIPQRPVLASPSDVEINVPDDVDHGLLEGFYQEAPGQTEHLVNLITNMLSEHGDISDIIAAKRIVHTIKGTGAIIGLTGLANFGHHFEDVLDYFESKGGEVNGNIASVLLDGAHCIAQMIAFLTGNDEFPNEAIVHYQNILDIANIVDKGGDFDDVHFRNGSSDSSDLGKPTQAVIPAGGSSQSALRVGMERIDELFRVSAEISVQTSAMEAQLKNISDFTKRWRAQQLKVKKRLFELETLVDVRSLALLNSQKESVEVGDSFDPLELEQYSELHSSTHALVEEFNDAVLLGEQLTKSVTDLNALENQHSLLSRDLQHLVIGTRMSEVGTLEARLKRNIRTTCQMTDKKAMLEFHGGDTLIDSDVLTQLADPLLHLLRNSVDHGIEDPETRISQGKDPVGLVQLSFASQGQQIFLTIKDDGKGLDFDKILSRAIENGQVDENDNLTENEIGQLIFTSGFSTRDSVSQVSGRGVGMDVVRNWLNTMNGDIQISSERGEGTTMILNFASSLTTVQSLIVSASDQAFALPSIQISQAFTYDDGSFKDVNGSLQYFYNDNVYGAFHLSDLLGYGRNQDLETCYAVLMQIQGETWAIAVDTLLDSRELLLKPPGKYIKNISGVTGTSILGNGNIAIHLDMSELVSMVDGNVSVVASNKNNDVSNTHVTSVLIVDDSLSVRNTLQQLVEDAGYNVETAIDGIEAVNVLDNFTPDVILTDLEMPNMNGVELTKHIRNRASLKNLPIIMITSRSQDKHMDIAFQAGVNTYLTKPYNDTEVIKTISSVLSGSY